MLQQFVTNFIDEHRSDFEMVCIVNWKGLEFIRNAIFEEHKKKICLTLFYVESKKEY